MRCSDPSATKLLTFGGSHSGNPQSFAKHSKSNDLIPNSQKDINLFNPQKMGTIFKLEWKGFREQIHPVATKKVKIQTCVTN